LDFAASVQLTIITNKNGKRDGLEKTKNAKRKTALNGMDWKNV
jgi:hypothetical protein